MLKRLQGFIGRRVMRRSVRIATEALHSEHFDIDEVLRRLADTNDSDQLLRAYIAIQIATNLSGPISNGDITYGLQLLRSAGGDDLALNKDLAELGWSHRAQELLDRKEACRANEYSYEAVEYRFEKAKKGPGNYEEREKWKQMSAGVAQAKETLDANLDEKASREAAESVLQNLLDEVKAEKTNASDLHAAASAARERLRARGLLRPEAPKESNDT